MDIFEVVIHQIALLIIYVLIGALLLKTKVLSKDNLSVLSSYVLKLALPLLIFTNAINGVEREALLHSVWILVLTAIMYVALFALGHVLRRVLSLKGDRAQLFSALTMFGNVGFIGIPLISCLFPQNGLLYVAVFSIIDLLTLWSLGVKMTSPSGKGHFNWKKVCNPAMLANVLALVFVLLGIKLPSLVNDAFVAIGATSTPVAMIYLGGIFVCSEVKKHFKVKEYYGIAILKMLIFPVLLYLFTGLFPVVEEVRLTITILACLPSMVSVVMMANSSGSDGDYALGGVLVTTVCSIVAIPLLCYVLPYLP